MNQLHRGSDTIHCIDSSYGVNTVCCSQILFTKQGLTAYTGSIYVLKHVVCIVELIVAISGDKDSRFGQKFQT